ncbi:MAG: histidine kinase, partial [Bacteroidales bacterium]|nr:histidine kinase [Bacteroidales bacterium]
QAASFPEEASGMLKELSRSLRQQLYESDQKSLFPDLTQKTDHPFREQNRLLDFMIDKQYRWVRNLLLVIAVCIIGIANAKPHNSFPFLEFGIVSGIFLSIIYFNIYRLLPRLLLKNRFVGYFVVLVLSVLFFIVLFNLMLLSSDIAEELKGILGIVLISNIIQIGFVVAGTTAFVIFQHWARNERYIAQLEATTMRAELEQLQNQINPHFLFNMLNNILVLIQENREKAVVIMHKMSDMLKYQFNDSVKKEVRLSDDIHFLTDFLNLEEIRRDRFEFKILVENNMEGLSVPPLLFIPFVENAVKHSADSANLSYIRLHFKAADNMLHFACHNSKPLNPQKKNEFSGLGLANIKRRLELLYNQNHSLMIEENDTNYTVQLSIKI